MAAVVRRGRRSSALVQLGHRRPTDWASLEGLARSIRAKPSIAGKRPNECARRALWSRPTIIFPFPRRAPRGRVRRDCAERGGCVGKIRTHSRDRRRNSDPECRDGY